MNGAADKDAAHVLEDDGRRGDVGDTLTAFSTSAAGFDGNVVVGSHKWIQRII